ncbi:MAG: PQQ-like beta-propeller repeat protein [Bacteroidales bacterium]|nr:PQQ-like beta-propeller repeat protein [Bacteroidales bacterium]MCF8389152.1 PQQ-like beta-propeller repeat protein [Bacteroidales bacterium]
MIRTFFSLAIIIITQTIYSQHISWRGENSSGIFNESNLLKEWPEEGPQKLLSAEGIGAGWGSPISINDIIYVAGKKDSIDLLTAITLNGEILWQAAIGASWKNSFPDTRTTPTFDDDKLYALSGSGILACISAETGKHIWTKNVDSIYNTEWHNWGAAESPLIIGDLVITQPVGPVTAMVALNKFTGEEIWKTESIGGQRSYTTPVLYEYDSIKQIIGVTANDILAVDPENGEIIWIYKLSDKIAEIRNEKKQAYIFANSPIFKERRIYVSAGYDNISIMLELSEDGKSVSEKWIDRTLDNHHHGLVLIDGCIYGSNWYNNRLGNWVCMDWETGEVKWITQWDTKGVVVAADDMLYLYSEKEGRVGLVQPDKKEFKLISSFILEEGSGAHWAHPFIKDGKLFMRHGDALVVYDISGGK